MPSFLSIVSGLALSLQNIIIEGLLILSNFFSNKTRIERIMCQPSPHQSTRVTRIEQALKTHSVERFRELAWSSGEETDVACELLPSIDDDDQKTDYCKLLARSMRQIKGYSKLCDCVEQHRSILYDSSDEEHEKLLLKLWKLMMPGTELKERKCNQWQEIGFQGEDPATDFRGMGLLGLEQLCFFAQFDVENARKCLAISLHPRTGFPYAVCGITMTSIIRDFLYHDLLKNHFYNSLRTPPTLDNFHQAYCRVFTLYCEFWEYEDPQSVMMFNLVKEKFVVNMAEYLRRGNANLFEATLEDIS